MSGCSEYLDSLSINKPYLVNPIVHFLLSTVSTIRLVDKSSLIFILPVVRLTCISVVGLPVRRVRATAWM